MRRFTHTFPQRISAFLLCLALLAGLLPTAAWAADADKAIMLGTSGIAGYDSAAGYDYIYFGSWTAQDTYTTSGPIKWRVLDDQTNTGETGLFLLSDGLLGTGDYGGVYFDNTSPYSNTWQGSDAQTWCSTFYSNNLTMQEQGAVLATTKSDGAFTSSTIKTPFAASNNILNGDKVFFLSAEEAETSGYGFESDNDRKANYNGSEGCWWLRSPDAYGTAYAGLVAYDGSVRAYGDVGHDWAARPAFNLNLNSVLFTSAAVGGKAANGMDSGLTAVGGYDGNEWKLTLLDSSRNFSISDAAINSSGNTIGFSYSNAQTGTNEYISVVIKDSGAITHYGRILQLDGTTNGESGTASLTLPAGVTLDNDTKLYVFNEQYNGDKMTDYASQLKEISPTVDTTAPTLTAGTATRTGETTATVKFTSNEAGSYYYAVVESGATEPTDIVSGDSANMASGENTINLTNLTAGAKDIYIVAKDAVNNVSNVLTIPIPAYTYTLTVNLNGGSGNTTGGQYPAGEVVNIDAGSRSNYRFTGWTTSNDGSFASASSASTTFTMPAADTTITANWQYNPPYIPPTYAVTVPETTGGTVEVSPSRASSGRRVTITTQPAPGYELESLTVLDSRGSEIALTVQGDGKYTFTMPSRKVTVQASFAPVPLPFEDVPPGAWYESAVRYVYTHSIMEGMSATKFSPNISLTRAEAVQVLYNLEDQPTVSNSTTFPDLVYQWYKPAIAWAESTGVVDGYEDGTFRPGQPVTRQEFAQMLYDYAAYKDYDLTAKGDLSRFPDGNQVQEWALSAMTWANGNALINGHDDGALEPGGTTTRAQAAAILMRFDQDLAE